MGVVPNIRRQIIDTEKELHITLAAYYIVLELQMADG